MFRKEVARALAAHVPKSEDEILQLLEVPPDRALGDYAFPCFTLAKELKKAPPMIAQELAAKLASTVQAGSVITSVKAVGPYINLFIAPNAWAEQTITQSRSGALWGFDQRNKKIMVEYVGPNTNKPLHLGHARNMILGSAVVAILKKDGNAVVPVNINNDRGVHICKSMLAYQKFGDGKKPDKKSDFFVGDFYVLYDKKLQEHPEMEEEIRTMLKQWEEGDPTVRALWKQMNDWAFAGFKETYKRYGVSFVKEYYESAHFERGKQIVLDNMQLFKQDKTGAVFAPLEQYGLPDKIVLRSDGTSVYMTQDLALTLMKEEDFHPDTMIWVVASEQNLHFQQLFQIMQWFGLKKEKLHHLSYGMVALPEGKMKSREGTVVDADTLLDDMEALAAEEISKRREDWDEQKIAAVSKVVALGAVRFFILKYDPAKNFVFDPKQSLSFEGDTGPYLQYTHARICSILRKEPAPKQADYALLDAPEEQELLKMIAALPGAFRKAADEYRPSTIAVQLLEVGRAFNSFYHACPVLKANADMKAARLALIDAVRSVLKEGLDLLGITAPEEM